MGGIIAALSAVGIILTKEPPSNDTISDQIKTTTEDKHSLTPKEVLKKRIFYLVKTTETLKNYNTNIVDVAGFLFYKLNPGSAYKLAENIWLNSDNIRPIPFQYRDYNQSV